MTVKNGKMLTEAIQLAIEAHGDQERIGGGPYILHPLRVMLDVANKTNDDHEMMAASVLHDVAEDTSVGINEITIRFPPRVARLVKILTKVEGEDYATYLSRVKANPQAMIIKLADLKDNSNIESIKFTKDPGFLYLRYARARAFLEGLTKKF